MVSEHDKKAVSAPRAEDGMELTLLAVKFQIALAILPLFFGLGIINIIVLVAFYFGLSARKDWATFLFACFCIFGFFNAISNGITVTSLLNLIDAVLKFVAFCGIVIWFRGEQKGTGT